MSNLLGVVPEAAQLVSALKADGFKPLIQTTLDAGQTAAPAPNNRNTLGHGGLVSQAMLVPCNKKTQNFDLL